MYNLIKIVVLVSTLVAYNSTKAQTIVPKLVPSPYVTVEDLWNFDLVTPPNGELQQARITINVYNADGQTVIISRSNSFTSNSGILSINKYAVNSLGPIENIIANGSGSETAIKQGFLPAGTYNVVYAIDGMNSQQQAYSNNNASINLTIDAISPPLLLFPQNEDTISTKYPLFSWSPSASGLNRITYDLVVSEIYDGQSPEQAVNANPAYFNIQDLYINSITYPISARQLKTNQWYAWRVIAKVGSVPMARTETWKFILKDLANKECEPKPVKYYYQLQETTTGTTALIDDGQLNFFFTERYSSPKDELVFNLYNAKNKKVASNKTISKNYKQGLNYTTILLTQNDAVLPKGKYLLEVIIEKRGKLYLKIDLINDVIPCIYE